MFLYDIVVTEWGCTHLKQAPQDQVLQSRPSHFQQAKSKCNLQCMSLTLRHWNSTGTASEYCNFLKVQLQGWIFFQNQNCFPNALLLPGLDQNLPQIFPIFVQTRSPKYLLQLHYGMKRVTYFCIPGQKLLFFLLNFVILGGFHYFWFLFFPSSRIRPQRENVFPRYLPQKNGRIITPVQLCWCNCLPESLFMRSMFAF